MYVYDIYIYTHTMQQQKEEEDLNRIAGADSTDRSSDVWALRPHAQQAGPWGGRLMPRELGGYYGIRPSCYSNRGNIWKNAE